MVLSCTHEAALALLESSTFNFFSLTTCGWYIACTNTLQCTLDVWLSLQLSGKRLSHFEPVQGRQETEGVQRFTRAPRPAGLHPKEHCRREEEGRVVKKEWGRSSPAFDHIRFQCPVREVDLTAAMHELAKIHPLFTCLGTCVFIAEGICSNIPTYLLSSVSISIGHVLTCVLFFS